MSTDGVKAKDKSDSAKTEKKESKDVKDSQDSARRAESSRDKAKDFASEAKDKAKNGDAAGADQAANAAQAEADKAKAEADKSQQARAAAEAAQRAATEARNACDNMSPPVAAYSGQSGFDATAPARPMAVAAAPVEAAASASYAPGDKLEVNSPPGLNLRSGPGASTPSQGVLPDRTSLTVSEPPPGEVGKPGWVHVTTDDGRQGWVSESFVSKPGAARPVDPATQVTDAPAPAPREGPLALGHHMAPDMIVGGWGTEGSIRAEINRVADLGAHSATLMIRADSPPEALKWAADQAANRGIKLELRVDFADKQSVPIHMGAGGQYTYNAGEGAALADGLIKQLEGLDDRQRGAIGSIQLGNEPLDPKEHRDFLGKNFSTIAAGTDINAEYQQLVAAAGTTPAAVARSMGLAVRDMYVDVGQKLVDRFGEGIRTQMATPATGAGYAAYNDVTSQREYFLGVMGQETNGTWGRSAFEYAAQAGQHAYMEKGAMDQGAYPTSTEGYEQAVQIAAQAGRTNFGRPVFTEVGLDNRSPGALESFMTRVVDVWNQAHPDKTVASASIWGSHPNYVHEPIYEMKDPAAIKGTLESYHNAYANR